MVRKLVQRQDISCKRVSVFFFNIVEGLEGVGQRTAATVRIHQVPEEMPSKSGSYTN